MKKLENKFDVAFEKLFGKRLAKLLSMIYT